VNEHDLLQIVEVMVMAKLYGHDLRLSSNGGDWSHALYCMRCRRSQGGTVAYLTMSNWEEPCKGKPHAATMSSG
jgi:hypothetical protein